jgi:chromatin remodeling complex protein RSC6
MSDTLALPLSSNNQSQISRNTLLRGKFFIPTKISDRLSVFLGKENGTDMTRMDVTREIYKYIGLNNLQDNKNKIMVMN